MNRNFAGFHSGVMILWDGVVDLKGSMVWMLGWHGHGSSPTVCEPGDTEVYLSRIGAARPDQLDKGVYAASDDGKVD